VQFRIEGDDPARVRAIADRIKELVRANGNTLGLNDTGRERQNSCA